MTEMLRWIFATAAIVPIAILTLVTLLAFALRGAWRESVLWMILLGVAIALGAATKVLHYGWGVDYGLAVFRGFSGHTLRAAAVFPVFAYALMAGAPRSHLYAALALMLVLAALVVVAAVYLQVHTLPEALAGAALGAGAAFVLCRRGALAPLSISERTALVVLTAASWLWTPSWRPDMEKKLLHFSHDLRAVIHHAH